MKNIESEAEQILKKYLDVTEEKIIRPALIELEAERHNIAAELKTLEGQGTEAGGEEDREIMLNSLRLRLERVDKTIRGLRPQFLGILQRNESMEPDEGKDEA